MRRTSSPLRAVRIDRSSPATAEGVTETLLARSPKAGRRAVLQFLAESIASVSTTSNDRWGVTLDPGHVRFNTGQTESVVFWPDQVDVLVKDMQSVDGMTLGRLYRNLPPGLDSKPLRYSIAGGRRSSAHIVRSGRVVHS